MSEHSTAGLVLAQFLAVPQADRPPGPDPRAPAGEVAVLPPENAPPAAPPETDSDSFAYLMADLAPPVAPLQDIRILPDLSIPPPPLPLPKGGEPGLPPGLLSSLPAEGGGTPLPPAGSPLPMAGESPPAPGGQPGDILLREPAPLPAGTAPPAGGAAPPVSSTPGAAADPAVPIVVREPSAAVDPRPAADTTTQQAGERSASPDKAPPAVPPPVASGANLAAGDHGTDAQGDGERGHDRTQTDARAAEARLAARLHPGGDVDPRASGMGLDGPDLPGHLQPAGTTTGSTATTTPPATGVLNGTLSLAGERAAWSEPLARHLSGLVTNGINAADLRLSPPNLGHLEVRISFSNDQVSVWLASANADVRDALQQALPRLDALLNSMGIRLADAGVQDGQFDSFFQQQPGNPEDPDFEAAEEAITGRSITTGRLGLVDYWA